MDKIKMGILGTGKMGQNHCKALTRLGHIHFIGVFDTDEGKCQSTAKAYGVKAYSSHHDLLNDVDAIIIATPTSTHYPLIIDAISANTHLFIEKPIAATLKEVNGITNSLKGKNLVIQVGHIERFNPAIQELQNFIKPEDIISIESRRTGNPGRNHDVDVILDLMIHDIDIILHLVNSAIKRVSSGGRAVYKEGNVDIASVIIEFHNGVIATMVANRISQEKTRTLKITEQNRSITLDYLTKDLCIFREPNGSLTYKIDSLIEKILVPNIDALTLELSDFSNCIKNNTAPQVGLDDGKKALEMALKIKEQLNVKE
jgi:predicted dehydrogenase